MLTFPDHYFENEVRCGFHITAMMKRFWAAQLEVLSWIDSVCRKYDIHYIMCFGSLIGTVRHKGFIPWDDDIDIGMLRGDYNRFIEVLPREIPPYISTKSLLPGASQPKEMIFGIGNGNRLDTTSFFLNRFHGCPYAVMVDLYVFDKIPTNPDDYAYQDRLIRLLDRMLMLQWDADSNSLTKMTFNEYDSIRKYLEEELDYSFTDNEPMTLQILRLLDLACGLCEDCNSERVENREQMLYYGDRGFCVEHFNDRLLIPYEELMNVPVPRNYDQLLRNIYGDYYIPVKYISQHPYPQYCQQREILYTEYNKRNLQVPAEFLEYGPGGELILDPDSLR